MPIKPLEENRDMNLRDLALSSVLDMTSKAQATKESLNGTSSKLKIFCCKRNHQESKKTTQNIGKPFI